MAKSMQTLLYVKWYDAAGGGSHWIPLNEVRDREPAVVESVGFLIDENKQSLTIAAHCITGSQYGDQCCGDMTILKTCVIAMRKLKMPR